LPGLFFICLYGLSSAYLQCENRFFLSSAAPIAFNAIWIFAVLAFRYDEFAMHHLSIAVVVAFALQWLVSFVPIFKELTWSFVKTTRPFSAEVRAVMLPFALGILGVGASQINNALDALFARYASLEGPAYLWYAIRLQQLPLVLFGMAWSTALLPALAKERTLALLQYAIEKCALFLIPVSFALIPCAAAGVNLLFGHGGFTSEATYQTTLCLWGYGLGLFPSALVMMLAAFAFAQKNYRIPSVAAVLTVGVNLILNSLMVFVFRWGVLSIAIATSLSQIFNALYLMNAYKPFDAALKKTLIRLTVYSGIAAFISVLFYPDPLFQGVDFPRTIGAQLLNLIYPFICFLVIFALLLKFVPKRFLYR
ncbi:MAG TPA: lipid II flippase MurJ, partial [Chlamydiales bacterium]|nr:lipid II flippase MurJ [Chlamydiales bacterium]